MLELRPAGPSARACSTLTCRWVGRPLSATSPPPPSPPLPSFPLSPLSPLPWEPLSILACLLLLGGPGICVGGGGLLLTTSSSSLSSFFSSTIQLTALLRGGLPPVALAASSGLASGSTQDTPRVNLSRRMRATVRDRSPRIDSVWKLGKETEIKIFENVHCALFFCRRWLDTRRTLFTA